MIFRKFLYVIILVSLSSSGQLLLKKGALNFDWLNLKFSVRGLFALILGIAQNGWLLGGLFFLGLTFLLYLLILSRVQLNIIYPVMVSGSIILITLASRLFFQEFLSFWQFSGIFFIIFGIFLVFSQRTSSAWKFPWFLVYYLYSGGSPIYQM